MGDVPLVCPREPNRGKWKFCPFQCTNECPMKYMWVSGIPGGFIAEYLSAAKDYEEALVHD